MDITQFPEYPRNRFWGFVASLICCILGFGRLTCWSRDERGFEYIGGEHGCIARRKWRRDIIFRNLPEPEKETDESKDWHRR